MFLVHKMKVKGLQYIFETPWTFKIYILFVFSRRKVIQVQNNVNDDSQLMNCFSQLMICFKISVEHMYSFMSSLFACEKLLDSARLENIDHVTI